MTIVLIHLEIEEQVHCIRAIYVTNDHSTPQISTIYHQYIVQHQYM